jgi:hypothetical protein
LRMLGSSSGGILGCKEHGPNPRIVQITTDELLGSFSREFARGQTETGFTSREQAPEHGDPAIKDLQRQAGLPQTGTMNAATQKAMDNYLAHGNNQMGGNS